MARIAKARLIFVMLGLIILSTGITITAFADSSGPTFSTLSPSETESVDSSTVTISAQASDPDGINPESTYFELDGDAKIGVMIRLSGNPNEATIQYSATGLAPGTHNVKIYLQDNLGNGSYVTWSFRVKEGVLLPPEQEIPGEEAPGGELPGEENPGEASSDGEQPGEQDPGPIEGAQILYWSPVGKVNSIKPVIRSVLSGVDTSASTNTRLMLNGNEIPALVTPVDADKIYIFSEIINPLSVGKQSIEIVAKGKNGISNSFRWFFAVNPSSVEPLTVKSPQATEIKTTMKATNVPPPYLLGQQGRIYFKKADQPNYNQPRVSQIVYDIAGSAGEQSLSYEGLNFTFGNQADGLYQVRMEVIDKFGFLAAPAYEQSFVIRDEGRNTGCTKCHQRKPYDHPVPIAPDKCQVCHRIVQPTQNPAAGCGGCHADPQSWPHGPEVLVSPRLSSTSTSCDGCHINSRVKAESKQLDANYLAVKNHEIIYESVYNQTVTYETP